MAFGCARSLRDKVTNLNSDRLRHDFDIGMVQRNGKLSHWQIYCRYSAYFANNALFH